MSKRLLRKIHKNNKTQGEVYFLIYENDTLLFPEHLKLEEKYLLEIQINIILKSICLINTFALLKNIYGVMYLDYNFLDVFLEQVQRLNFNTHFMEFNNITLIFSKNEPEIQINFPEF